MTGTQLSIIGFGRIGQAIATQMLIRGVGVNAIDTDASLIEAFARDTYRSTEPGVEAILRQAIAAGHLHVSSDYSTVDDSLGVIVTLPLSVDADHVPLAAPFLESLEALLPYVNDELLISIETSLPVGFSRNKVLPFFQAHDKDHGQDFFLAHSPERIKSGTMIDQLNTLPKIIGGLDAMATGRAIEMYQLFIEVIHIRAVASIEEAELVKMAGMIYRDVNIALANQLATYADKLGLDLATLIPLINTDGEAGLLQPGIGVGGHCTPVYPWFMIDGFNHAGLDFTLAREARRINDAMASYAVKTLVDVVTVNNWRRSALVLGLSFRAGVKEDANSASYLIQKELLAAGFSMQIHDPMYAHGEIEARGIMPVADPYETNATSLILVTMHEAYQQIDWTRMAAAGVKIVVDGRNRLNRDQVESAGIIYRGLGR